MLNDARRNGAEMTRVIERDMARWAKLVKDGNIKFE